MGLNIDRLKDLATLHKKCKFSEMTDQEVKYGHVRVSQWHLPDLQFFQVLYAVLDSEIYMRTIIYAAFLEVSIKPYEMMPEGEIDLNVVLGWWTWAKNRTFDQKQLARNADPNASLSKRVDDSYESFSYHIRGKLFSVEVEAEKSLSPEDALKRGSMRREQAVAEKKQRDKENYSEKRRIQELARKLIMS